MFLGAKHICRKAIFKACKIGLTSKVKLKVQFHYQRGEMRRPALFAPSSWTSWTWLWQIQPMSRL